MMEEYFAKLGISKALLSLANEAEDKITPYFEITDNIAYHNQLKVLSAFHEHRVSDAHFAPSSGYGYDDLGRDTLDRVYAHAFGCEAALVRHNMVSGTHALAVMLFGVLRPGDTLISVTGKPYDTLESIIGINDGSGSLKDFGVSYKEVALKSDKPDYEEIKKVIENTPRAKAILIQRSKGYDWRPSFTVLEISRLCKFIKSINPNIITLVDNCYGEFVEKEEPVAAGADLMAGSLIKNPGGGLAQSGGYVAGKENLVHLAANRLIAPGIGMECGANLGTAKSMYQGFFMAPHIVAQSIKTAVFCAAVLENLGYEVSPKLSDKRTDIIQAIKFGDPNLVIAFCKGLQRGSPIDSFVTPEPFKMPGYTSAVIMAAGAFTQGASIEVSADGPIRPPYIAYLQGGLTYESGKIAVLTAIQSVLKTIDS